MRHAEGEIGAGFNVDGHHFVVRDEVKLPAIGAPTRAEASFDRYLARGPASRDWLDVNLQTVGRVGTVQHPAPVRRDLSVSFRVGRLPEDPRLSLTCQGQQPQIFFSSVRPV